MSLTRIAVETELVKRQGARMSLVGMDIAVSDASENADLQSPIATAMRKLGYLVSNPVTDSDLSVIPDETLDEFYDRAELRLLSNIKGNLVMVDISTGPRRESLGQLSNQIKDDIKDLKEKITQDYGSYGLLTAGAVSLNFQQKLDDEDAE